MPEAQIFRQLTKQHAKEADEYFGFQILKIEAEVRKLKNSVELAPFETWTHLEPQIFLTPYLELRFIFSHLPIAEKDIFLDLGCAYARIPFILNAFYPTCAFIGLDCVSFRIQESARIALLHQFPNVTFECANICATDFALPRAQHWFIYDCGSTADVEKILEKLRAASFYKGSTIKSLTVRGARVRHIIKSTHHWLPSPSLDNQNFSIYKF